MKNIIAYTRKTVCMLVCAALMFGSAFADTKLASDPVSMPEIAETEKASEPAKEKTGKKAKKAAKKTEKNSSKKSSKAELINVTMLSLKTASTAVAEGDTAAIELQLFVGNEDGAKIKNFILEIVYENAASAANVSKVIKNMKVKENKLNKLKVSETFIPFTADNGDACAVIVSIYDTDKEKTLIRSYRLVFVRADAEAVEEIAEEPVEEITEEPVEEIVEEPVEEIAEELEEEIVEEPAEEIVEEPAEEIAEELVAEIAEEPVEEIAEEHATEIVEEPVEEIVEEPAEEIAEEPVGEIVEEPVEEVAEELVEEEVNAEEPAGEELVEEEVSEVKLQLVLGADPAELTEGDVLVFKAVVEGLEEGTYVIIWQCDNGVAGEWTDIEGAVGDEYAVTFAAATAGWSWRFVVDVM